jgi:transcriptional regulator with XRE-family HTH domain
MSPRGSRAAPAAGSGPTALRMMLGGQLRRLREARGVSREEAAALVRGSASKISRMELGRVGFKARDVADLLTLYGVTDPDDREPLLELAEQANQPSWWHRFSDALPSWFHTFVGLEEAAAQIRAYEPQFVPGLLQTEDYARAVIHSTPVRTPYEELEARVKARMARQALLTQPDAPQLWVVLDEGALHRTVGGLEVMRAQLERLLEASAWPRVILQVLPFGNGANAAGGGPFVLLRFRDPTLPDIAYVEQLISALYLDKPEEVEVYTAALDHLCVRSLTPAASQELIAQTLDRLR